ncbi:MAG: aminotransferase class IV [Chloroflexi bacterium]|nr:aminotransferase class IV [Chloroflexota bacterium]
MADIVYLNGELLPRHQACLSPFDHGFLYGYGLFETMRAYGGRVFRLGLHLERLQRSARFLGLALEGLELEKAVVDTLRANGLADARLRLTVSAGEGQAIPDPATCRGPTVLVTATSYQPPSPQSYQSGWTAITSSICRNSRSPLCQMKGIAYIDSVLARRQARAAGADEALLLNEKGLLAEASTSNLFLVEGSLLLTPRDEDGALAGITRAAVFELSPALGLSAAQASLMPSGLAAASEVFVTSSLIEIMPLVRVDDKTIGSGAPGPVTQRLAEAYREMVKRETGTTLIPQA